MIYVIGSGPAGVSTCIGLLENGHEVTLLDYSNELESEKADLVNSMSQSEPEQWTAEQQKQIRGATFANTSGVPKKFVYGSDFHYRDAEYFDPTNGVEIYSSLAKGGLSNVWGAAVMPFLPADMREWPFPIEDLNPYIQSLLKVMPFSAASDDLKHDFPLLGKPQGLLKITSGSEDFLVDLKKNKYELGLAGVQVGGSRLAVGAEDCRYCALCLYGCPYNLIFNSSNLLSALMQNSKFTYKPGILVKSFREEEDKIVIQAWQKNGSENLEFTGKRLFLAAGVLSTANIVLNSLNKIQFPLTVKCSQHFVLPFLRYVRATNYKETRFHTLAQFFIEIIQPKLSPKSVHLQFYSYNDLFEMVLKQKLGFIYRLFENFFRSQFLSRLFIIQGYLHSDCSEKIQLVLPQLGEKLELRPVKNAEMPRLVKRISSHLFQMRKLIRGIPISPMLKISAAGGGAHSGCTFPMSRHPTDAESDICGRPFGLKRVHLVDSSCLPSIGAQTITLTVMANALRIAKMDFAE